jgi:tRNA(Arg) A34 adenosine deaminase TadA
MALVHSRVGRVVFAIPEPRRGALGSRYSLHCQQGLNHHYRVFQYDEVAQHQNHRPSKRYQKIDGKNTHR